MSQHNNPIYRTQKHDITAQQNAQKHFPFCAFIRLRLILIIAVPEQLFPYKLLDQDFPVCCAAFDPYAGHLESRIQDVLLMGLRRHPCLESASTVLFPAIFSPADLNVVSNCLSYQMVNHMSVTGARSSVLYHVLRLDLAVLIRFSSTTRGSKPFSSTL